MRRMPPHKGLSQNPCGTGVLPGGFWGFGVGSKLLLPAMAALLAFSATTRQLLAQQPDSGRECAVCHLGWAAPFNQPKPNALVDRPPNAAVASEATCFDCHDSSVDDSRRKVWLQHGHATGMTPPVGMNVPPQLPLEDGKVVCRTCHTAHAGTGTTSNLADVFFLRMNNDRGQLCLACHGNYADPAVHSHPMIEMPMAVPQELIQAGAAGGPSGQLITCRTCHTPHGSGEDHLLVAGVDDNSLCMACHERLAPEIWQTPLAKAHSRSLPLTAPQQAAVKQMGGHATPDGKLNCLSCHRMHEPPAADYNLVASLKDSRLCLGCHADQAEMFGTAHDLRQSAPQAASLLGPPIADLGPCSACHTSHRVVPTAGLLPAGLTAAPPDDLCIRCHRPEGIAAAKPFTQFRHPTGPATLDAAAKLTTDLPLYNHQGEHDKKGYVACASCHNPHARPDQPAMLRTSNAQSNLCINCHTELASLTGGLHDESQHPAKWPETARQQPNLCMSCHQVHSNDPQRELWTVQPRGNYAIEDGACLGCHTHVEWYGHGTAPAEPATRPANTPAAPPSSDLALHGLPLVPTGPGKRSGAIGCKTCHNPHGPPSEVPHLLREARLQEPAAMCLRCHQDLQYIGLSLHSHEAMLQFAERRGDIDAKQVRNCGPCHEIHGPAAADLVPGIGRPDARNCVSCHGPSGGATEVPIFEHFPPQLQNVAQPGEPGFMPLLDEQGNIGRAGHIDCVTCHLPHGRVPGPAFPAVKPGQITQDQLRAMMPMITPYNAPNLCTSCHGYEGLVRFLYWHQPAKRGQP